MSDRPFRNLCPEADLRDKMDDGEFWEHVFNRTPFDARFPAIQELDIEDDAPDEEIISDPCEVCGASGPCLYDLEGRPLIHCTPKDDDE